MTLVYPVLAFLTLGAIAIYLVLPREKNSLVGVGSLLGISSLVGLLLYFQRAIPATTGSTPPVFFYVFAGIMVIGSVAVVANPKPVYAALYFVLVTLAGAGIFVLLMAEFMAIVLIIIYAGAILVTYVFVIMLASQAGKSEAPLYDRVASEPMVAVLVSFVFLGTLLNVMFPDTNAGDLNIARRKPDAAFVASVRDADSDAQAPVTGTNAIQAAPLSTVPSSTQVLGNSLYGTYPISLEIAGVLLTIALVGAVVIARKHSEANATGTLASGTIPIA